VIDVGQLTLIPGLIDVHTHMTYYWDRRPGTKPLGQPRRPRRHRGARRERAARSRQASRRFAT
jgi:imidazolonepropionase-like amidohydrolase